MGSHQRGATTSRIATEHLVPSLEQLGFVSKQTCELFVVPALAGRCAGFRLKANAAQLRCRLQAVCCSGAITLRQTRTGTLYVSTVVNGDKTKEMILDSGANLTSLPHEVAKAMGIYVKETDPDITLVMADGREISAKLVQLDSIRVGKFHVDDVEAAVLGREATSAEPLLGMSFLSHFKFEINAAESKLTMVKIDSDGKK